MCVYLFIRTNFAVFLLLLVGIMCLQAMSEKLSHLYERKYCVSDNLMLAFDGFDITCFMIMVTTV